jgi:hypothetical protein
MQIATMGSFFHDYWWLLFPLGWFIAAGFGSFMRYKRTQSKLDLMKAYAASGNEPPAELMAALNDDGEGEDEGGDSRTSHVSGRGRAFLVILFGGFAALFAYEGYAGFVGIGEVGYFISAIFVILALAFLGSGLFDHKPKRD